MNELIEEFKSESQEIVETLLDQLDEIEADLGRIRELESYGQKVDRIMGGAMSLAMMLGNDPLLMQIGSCAGMCKAVGYRGSQVGENKALSNAVVAFLIDMTELIRDMVEACGEENSFDLEDRVFLTMTDRLKWISEQFQQGLRSSLKIDEDQDLSKDIEKFMRSFNSKN